MLCDITVMSNIIDIINFFRELVFELQELKRNFLNVVTSNGKTAMCRVYLDLISADNFSAHHVLGLQNSFNSGQISRYCLSDYS